MCSLSVIKNKYNITNLVVFASSCFRVTKQGLESTSKETVAMLKGYRSVFEYEHLTSTQKANTEVWDSSSMWWIISVTYNMKFLTPHGISFTIIQVEMIFEEHCELWARKYKTFWFDTKHLFHYRWRDKGMKCQSLESDYLGDSGFTNGSYRADIGLLCIEWMEGVGTSLKHEAIVILYAYQYNFLTIFYIYINN